MNSSIYSRHAQLYFSIFRSCMQTHGRNISKEEKLLSDSVYPYEQRGPTGLVRRQSNISLLSTAGKMKSFFLVCLMFVLIVVMVSGSPDSLTCYCNSGASTADGARGVGDTAITGRDKCHHFW